MSTTHPDLPGSVAAPTKPLPGGYVFGVTRYADVILADAFPQHWQDLGVAFDQFTIERSELVAGGGNQTTMARRFDGTLRQRGWGKRRIEIEKRIDNVQVMAVRGHEIDMFKEGAPGNPYPGIGCEMEWNNKDPFFDRDLNNFAALHREGVLAVGVIVTRGPQLHAAIRQRVPGGTSKYGASTTWWEKLVPRVNLGGGGECPLLLAGIEIDRVPDL